MIRINIEDGEMLLERYVVGNLETNCYLLGDQQAGLAVVIDPGGSADRIAGRLREQKLKLEAIINTHGHFDHVLDTWTLKDLAGGRIYLHERDKFLLNNNKTGLRALFAPNLNSIRGDVDTWVKEGEVLQFGSIRMEVLETPGHTPGHISLYLPDENIIFVGDTLFAGSIGRTDFPGGDYDQLIRSVEEKLFPLKGETRVFPGHGPDTTIAREKRTNPFFH